MWERASQPLPLARPRGNQRGRVALRALEFERVVKRRRMCRSFTDVPVPIEKLDRALGLAARAPSAGNSCGFAFVVLEGDQVRLFWQLTADQAWLEHPDHPGLLNAPVIILPLASRASYVARYAKPDKANVGGPASWSVPYWLVDTAFATMLLLLGLEAEGLAALFFALHKGPEPLLEQLGAPPGWEPIGAVATGWPGPSKKPSYSTSRPRRDFEQVVHRGHWHN
jgi:nitroreductase